MSSKTSVGPIAEGHETSNLETDCTLTDEEFIKRFKKLSGQPPLRITLRLAALCAAKTSFSAEKHTLKEVGLSQSKFSKYSQIGRDRRIEQIKGQLPNKAGYSVLYAMSQLSDDQWKHGFEADIITPRSSRSEIDAFRTGTSRKKTPRHKSLPFFAALTVNERASGEETARLRARLITLCEEFGCEAVFPISEGTS